MQWQQQIEQVLDKAKRLKENAVKVAAKNEELDAEIKRLKFQLKEEAEAKAELLNQVKIIKLARSIEQGNTDNADVTELKRKINEYIKEIDACINLLND